MIGLNFQIFSVFSKVTHNQQNKVPDMLQSRPSGSTRLYYLANDLILCKMKKSAKKSTFFSSFSIVLYYNFLTRRDNIVPISIKVVDNMHNNNVLLKKS